MADPHAGWHTSAMDAHTARCLQLSTSISMPFNPYRSFRVPDHNRSRFPVNMPQQQRYRPAPVRTTSYDGWYTRPHAKSSVGPIYTPSFNSQSTHVRQQSTPGSISYTPTPSSTAYTPNSTDMSDSGHFPFSLNGTPEIQDPSDFWGDVLKSDYSGNPSIKFQDFGLGLEPFGTDLNSLIINSDDSNVFPYGAVLADVEQLPFEPGSPEGRSWSSISDASSGFVSEFPELSLKSEAPGLCLDTMSPGLDGFLSPETRSSEFPQSRFVKPSHRGVVDSSPRGRYRIAPYPTAAGRSRSLSTGSVAFSRPQLASPFVHRSSPSLGYDFHQSYRPPGANNMSTIPDINFEQLYQPQPSRFPGGYFNQDGLFIPSLAERIVDMPCSSISSSPNATNVLHSSSPARTRCDHHFAGSSKPPDLFGPLQERPLSPPIEDLDCEEDVVPRAQQLRFEGDLYTPKYVRGHGNKREGWCGICKPGRWLVLKNSAFWYDKSFTHGISAATGNAFEEPKQTRRMKGNPDVWEGLCHSCDEWIALISSKKKGTTWFRHAYKCHTHQKVKDAPKRRRDVSHSKAAKASKSTPAPCETRDGSPYSLDPTLALLDEETHPSPDSLSALQMLSAMD